jgi:hypothetical protein
VDLLASCRRPLLFALRQSLCMLGLDLSVTCCFAFFDLGTRLIDLGDQDLSPRDLIMDVECRIALVFRRLRLLHSSARSHAPTSP